MLLDNDFMMVLKAIEFMYHDIDITSFTKDDIVNKHWSSASNKLITMCTKDVADFCIGFNDSAKEFLEIASDYSLRQQRKFFLKTGSDVTPSLVVSKDIIVKTMKVLRDSGACGFVNLDPSLFDEDFQKKVNEFLTSFNRKPEVSCSFIDEMTKDKTRKDFNVLVSTLYGDYTEVRDKLLDAYDKEYKSFDIAGFEDAPIYDNRMFIPLGWYDIYQLKRKIIKRYPDIDVSSLNDLDGIKYLVISKNIYDYFFCSWGSRIQSCYSLNSDHLGCFGTIPFGTCEHHFIMYLTKDHPHKFNLYNTGKKINIPYMFWRAWAYSERKTKNLLVDRSFYKDDMTGSYIDNLMVNDLLPSLGFITDDATYYKLEDGEEMCNIYNEYKLRFYPDSLIVCSSEMKFRRFNGDKTFTGSKRFSLKGRCCNFFYNVLQEIKSISDTYNPREGFVIKDGNLFNPKICPKTGLMIDDSKSESDYAKFLNSPVSSVAILTYIDGSLYVTDLTKPSETGHLRFSTENNETFVSCDGDYYVYKKPCECGKINLQILKDKLKAFINESIYDVILLRIVDFDKITVQKFKKKGVF